MVNLIVNPWLISLKLTVIKCTALFMPVKEPWVMPDGGN